MPRPNQHGGFGVFGGTISLTPREMSQRNLIRILYDSYTQQGRKVPPNTPNPPKASPATVACGRLRCRDPPCSRWSCLCQNPIGAGHMATKRQRKSRQVPDDSAKPSPWRRQHGDVETHLSDVDPETGTVTSRHRSVDTLGMMLANATISTEMHDAGVKFRALFRSAYVATMPISSLARLRGQGSSTASENHLMARVRVTELLDMLGGHDSAAGSCAWHVLGCEASVREWAMRQGWSGRPVPAAQAQGMLVATLSVLAAHFDLPRRAARSREQLGTESSLQSSSLVDAAQD
jgi:hypothetical protein